MTSKFVQEGCVLDWVNGTGDAVTSGAVVLVGGAMFGVALADIADAAIGEVALCGVHIVPKVSAAVIAQGEALSWDISAAAFDDNLAVAEEGDITGGSAVAIAAAGAGVLTVKVRLTGVPGDITPAPPPPGP